MSGRFQVFVRAERDAVEPLRWRLLSENGRQLAFSARSFAVLEDAIADAGVAKSSAAAAVVLLTPPTRAGWGWVLEHAGDPQGTVVAVSARRFARRVECLESVARFRALAPVAAVGSVAVVFRHPPPGFPVQV